MSKIVKYFLIFWLFGSLVAVVLYIFEPENRSGLYATVFIVFVIAFFIGKEKLRRQKEGYYVYTRGGAEDGVVVYDEGGKTLNLYFDRREDTIYVPSDAKWQELMPEWAKGKKVLIVDRVRSRIGRRLIGKNWNYKESDNQDHLINQN